MRKTVDLLRTAYCATAALFSAFFASASSAQTQSDNLIVRNERVGAVRLGMTAAEVIAALGPPGETGFYRGEEGYLVYCEVLAATARGI